MNVTIPRNSQMPRQDKQQADQSPERDRIDLRAEPALVARARRQAVRLGISLSSYIRLAMVLKVEQDEATDPELADN